MGITLVVFVLEGLLPGGPARAILGQRATPAAISSFDHQYGLDRPILIQYWDYAWSLLHGNLGTSYKLSQPVSELLAERLPKTLILMLAGYLLALGLAIPLGITQAVRRNKVLADYVPTAIVLIVYSMPVFWLATLLVVWFSVDLGVLPPEAPQGPLETYISQASALVLPATTLALVTIAYFSRYVRSSVLENMVEDYIRTARAKGASERRVVFIHALPNALLPIITLAGLSLPGLFSGALVTETIFNYPGMGLLFYQAAIERDYPVIAGIVLVVGFATVSGSLLADIGYAVADPRIRYTVK